MDRHHHFHGLSGMSVSSLPVGLLIPAFALPIVRKPTSIPSSDSRFTNDRECGLRACSKFSRFPLEFPAVGTLGWIFST